MILKIDDKRAAEIQAREAKATGGPWWNPKDVHISNYDDGDGPKTHVFVNECTIMYPTSLMMETGGEYNGHDWIFTAHAREDIPDLLADRAAMLKEIERLQKSLADEKNAKIVIAATCNDVKCPATDEEAVEGVKGMATQLEEARKDRIEMLCQLTELQCDLASIFDWNTGDKTFIQCIKDLVQERNILQQKTIHLEASVDSYKRIVELCESLKEAIENTDKEPKIHEYPI